MTRKAISIYMSATCAMLIVAPGRFVCGILLASEVILLMLFGTLFRTLLKKIGLQKSSQTCVMLLTIFIVIFYKQLLILFMPEIAMQMGFIIYFPAITTFATVFLMENQQNNLKTELKQNMIPAFLFSIYSLLTSLFRDILGFGTITLPAVGKQLEIAIFNEDKVSALNFIATIPGSFVLSALLLAGYLAIERKLNILQKVKQEEDK